MRPAPFGEQVVEGDLAPGAPGIPDQEQSATDVHADHDIVVAVRALALVWDEAHDDRAEPDEGVREIIDVAFDEKRVQATRLRHRTQLAGVNASSSDDRPQR